jgi:hypothetical protein
VRGAFSGEIARELNLPAEWQHVGIKPRREQHLGLNAFDLAIGFRFVDEASERGKHLHKGGDG